MTSFGLALRMGLGLIGLNLSKNHIENSVEVIENVVIPESDDSNTTAIQIFSSLLIV